MTPEPRAVQTALGSSQQGGGAASSREWDFFSCLKFVSTGRWSREDSRARVCFGNLVSVQQGGGDAKTPGFEVPPVSKTPRFRDRLHRAKAARTRRLLKRVRMFCVTSKFEMQESEPCGELL